MNASFEEKSAWIQLLGMVATLALYALLASRILARGIIEPVAFVPVFILAVGVMVVVLVAGHVVVAIADRRTGSDERDRMIGWRAESNASWIVAVGVLTAVAGLVLAVERVWIAHLLMVSLFLAAIVKYVWQLIYYRRGM